MPPLSIYGLLSTARNSTLRRSRPVQINISTSIRRITGSSTTKSPFSPFTPIPAPPSTGVSTLNDTRALIHVSGSDSHKFLNGLTTNVVPEAPSGNFAAILNARGRVMCDIFTYPQYDQANSFFVECDRKILNSLLGFMKIHKLRSDVSIQPIDPEEASLIYIYNEIDSERTSEVLESITGQSRIMGAAFDERAPGFGLRMIIPTSVSEEVLKHIGEQQYPTVSSGQLTVRRYLNGIPEGVSEITPYQTLPMEYDFDYMEAINFEKGCYVGQELTIRTKHRGVVRKRVAPVRFFDFSVTTGEELELQYDVEDPVTQCLDSGKYFRELTITCETDAKNSEVSNSPFGPKSKNTSGTVTSKAGTIIGAAGNIGLALIRLEQFAKPGKFYIDVPNSLDNRVQRLGVKGFAPWWWPEEQ